MWKGQQGIGKKALLTLPYIQIAGESRACCYIRDMWHNDLSTSSASRDVLLMSHPNTVTWLCRTIEVIREGSQVSCQWPGVRERRGRGTNKGELPGIRELKFTSNYSNSMVFIFWSVVRCSPMYLVTKYTNASMYAFLSCCFPSVLYTQVYLTLLPPLNFCSLDCICRYVVTIRQTRRGRLTKKIMSFCYSVNCLCISC